MSLSSCAAYDVVSILQRQRQQLSGLYIDVRGTQNPEPPHEFTEVHLHLKLEGQNLEPAKVARAIDLSIDKYCSVAATIRGVATLTHSFEVLS